MSDQLYESPKSELEKDSESTVQPDFSQRWGRVVFLFIGMFALGISSIVAGMVGEIIGDENQIVKSIVFSLVLAIISSYRIRDFNFSGWFSLVAFIPYVNLLMLLLLLFIPGTKGINKYGYSWSRENQEKYGNENANKGNHADQQ